MEQEWLVTGPTGEQIKVTVDNAEHARHLAWLYWSKEWPIRAMKVAVCGQGEQA